jgi:hypothetical protein
MHHLLPAVLVLVLISASCVPPQRRLNPGPGPEVIAAVQLMYDDLSSRRWDALASHFLPDATLVFMGKSGPESKTPAQFLEMIKKNAEGKEIYEERMADAWVRTHENMGLVWSEFEARVGTEADYKAWSGIDCFTLYKVDGRWKISHVAVSVNPPKDKD